MTVAPSMANLPAGPGYDVFYLNGAPCPGLCKLKACNAAQDWDVRKGYGLSWATIVPSGEQLSKVEFSVKIWEGDQWNAFLGFASLYLSRPAPAQPGTTAPKSFGFSHGVASGPPFNVDAVVVLDVNWVEQGDDDDFFMVGISLLEWRPPIPAPPRPDQATPAVESAIPTAQDKLDVQTLAAVSTLNGQLETLQGLP
jgi:hypothetical protein